MQDAEKEKSVCQDIYAKDFMDARGLDILTAFQSEKNPNAGNVTRHRIIDDIIRAELLNNPDLQVILIGADFDSRAYRLTGGRWIELDKPQIISYKNERLPIEGCKNKLQRIPIDFGRPPTFNTEERAAINKRLDAGISIAEIAREFKTTRQTIIRVRKSDMGSKD